MQQAPPPGIAHGQNQMFTPPPQFHQQQQQPMHMNMNSFPNVPKFPAAANHMSDMNTFNGNHGGVDFGLLNSTASLTLNDLLLDNMKKSDKDVQFLQNVHFPEKAAMMHSMGGGKSLANSSYASYSHLLPTSMTFYDMATKPREFQYSWFVKLSEQFGLEEAGRFVELLRQVPNMTNATNNNNNSSMMSKPQMNGSIDDPSKNFMHLLDVQPSKAPADVKYQSLLKIPIAATYSEMAGGKMFQSKEIDSIFMNSIQNASFESAKDVDLKESSALLGSLFQQPTSSNPSNAAPGASFGTRDILNGLNIDLDFDSNNTPSPQQSVPLYKRTSKNAK
jgi:hypothetical protein